jgi:transposase-like protein
MALNAKATLEWHWYCPRCERTCHRRFHCRDEFQGWKIVGCSDCGTSYSVEIDESAVKALLDFIERG